MTTMSLLAMVLATLVAAQGLDVRSASDCPSSPAIREKLVPLLAEHGEEGDVAYIEVAEPEPNQPPTLRVRLVRADATVIADRRLPIQGGCEEMADTVAAVLAAWEAPPAPLPVALIETPPPRTEPAKAPDRPELWLGASGGAGWLGGTAVVGALELVLKHTGSHLLGRAAMSVQSSRQVDLGQAEGIWQRSYGSLGLGWQVRRPNAGSNWQAAIDVDLLLGALTASGRRLSPNAQETVFESGFGAGLRGQRTLGRWALWVETRASFWPAPERLVLDGTDSNTKLPKFDVQASFGISLLTSLKPSGPTRQ